MGGQLRASQQLLKPAISARREAPGGVRQPSRNVGQLADLPDQRRAGGRSQRRPCVCTRRQTLEHLMLKAAALATVHLEFFSPLPPARVRRKLERTGGEVSADGGEFAVDFPRVPEALLVAAPRAVWRGPQPGGSDPSAAERPPPAAAFSSTAARPVRSRARSWSSRLLERLSFNGKSRSTCSRNGEGLSRLSAAPRAAHQPPSGPRARCRRGTARADGRGIGRVRRHGARARGGPPPREHRQGGRRGKTDSLCRHQCQLQIDCASDRFADQHLIQRRWTTPMVRFAVTGGDRQPVGEGERFVFEGRSSFAANVHFCRRGGIRFAF